MANMHATEMGSPVDNSLVQAPHSPMAEVSATVLRAQAFTSASGAAMLARCGEELICRSANGACVPEFGARMAIQGTFLGLALESRKPQKCDDAETDLRVENASYGPVKPKSILAVPVRAGENTVGVLAVYAATANAFNGTHIAILRTMADAAARHVLQLPALTPAQPSPKTTLSDTAAPAKPAPAAAKAVQLPEAHRQELAAAVAQLVAPTALPTVSPAAAPPAAAKPQDELLVLAADPAPVARPRPTAVAAPTAPPRTIKFDPPPSLDLPQPRRRRTNRYRGPVRTAVIGLVAVALTAGWSLSRSVEMPLPVAAAAPGAPAPPAPPLVAPDPTAVSVPPSALAIVPSAVAAAPVTPAVASPPTASAPAKAKAAPVEEKAEPAPIVLAPVSKRVLRPTSEEAEAPQLALAAAAPALPVMSTSAAPALALRTSEVTPARPLQRVPPSYPPAAQRTKTAGTVVLSAAIRKDGSVAEVKIISGHPVFRDSALAAVRQWRYSPATLNGEPVETTAEIVLKFTAPK